MCILIVFWHLIAGKRVARAKPLNVEEGTLQAVSLHLNIGFQFRNVSLFFFFSQETVNCKQLKGNEKQQTEDAQWGKPNPGQSSTPFILPQIPSQSPPHVPNLTIGYFHLSLSQKHTTMAVLFRVAVIWCIKLPICKDPKKDWTTLSL